MLNKNVEKTAVQKLMNKKVILNKRPTGVPDADTWKLIESEVPAPSEDQILVEQYYISMDPAMRGWLNDVKSYLPPVQIGEVMRAGSVGKVIQSKNQKYQVGDYVYGTGGVQQYVVSKGRGWHKVDPAIVPLPVYTGTLGMPGLTAYFGMLDVGKIKAGDRVLISGAAGAVGSIAGQIAKIKGCEVVGIAGGQQKCNYLINELGFDSAIDYKNNNLRTALKEKCPKGIDVFFDNVGGEILNLALTKLRRNARVVICGAISQYNSSTTEGPSNYLSLLVNRARMEGFIILDYADRFTQGVAEMAQWMAQGQLKSKEHICKGIENFYDTFLRLFSGEKLGKLILQVGEEK